MNWPWQHRQRRVDMRSFAPLPGEGFLVGGAVRDALLKRSSHDLDWVVPEPEKAAREAASALGGRAFAIDPERDHWRVVADGTTRDYTPLEGSIEENLSQRDFRLNALAASPQGELLDPLDGQRDLRRREIRMLSQANLRADPLRPLRGARLAAQLGFRLEAGTKAAITGEAAAQLSGEVALPAWERVAEEINRLLLSFNAAYGLKLMDDTGLLRVYLPELAAAKGIEQKGFHHLDVLEHSLEALRQVILHFPDSSLALRWAALLHDVGKPSTQTFDETGRYYHFYGHDKAGAELAEGLLKRLRQPSELIKEVSGLVRYHMLPLPAGDKEAKRFLHRRRELLPDLLKVMVADREAARGPLASEKGRERYRLALARILRLMEEPPPAKPFLDGREIMALLELKPGPEVGAASRFLQEATAVGDIISKEEAEQALLGYAKHQGWR